jgi:sentrin-specific protease 1
MTPSHAKILELQRAKDARIEARLRPRAPPLPEALPADAEAEVTALLSRRGVIAKFARETVTDQDLARLQPAQWLNDEIINFYGALILARAEGAKENRAGPAKANGAGPTAQAGRGAPLDAYYMSSFFWEKLVKDGYEGGRLAKWTKKVWCSARGLCRDADGACRWTSSART